MKEPNGTPQIEALTALQAASAQWPEDMRDLFVGDDANMPQVWTTLRTILAPVVTEDFFGQLLTNAERNGACAPAPC